MTRALSDSEAASRLTRQSGDSPSLSETCPSASVVDACLNPTVSSIPVAERTPEEEGSERGDYCPWPMMDDGWQHEVRAGVCANCGARIRPVLMTLNGRRALWREPHCRLVRR